MNTKILRERLRAGTLSPASLTRTEMLSLLDELDERQEIRKGCTRVNLARLITEAYTQGWCAAKENRTKTAEEIVYDVADKYMVQLVVS